ncbi:MAG: Fe-S cluster assembly protein SufD [Longimicrobiales bacterium]
MADLAPPALGIGETLEREAVESLARADAPWLRARRLEAAAAYDRMPFPTTRLEEWRYTEVAQLKLDEVQIAELRPHTEVPAAARALIDGKAASGTVIQVDAAIAATTLDPVLAAQGVLLADLATAAVEHAELVEPYLGTRAVPAELGKFAALNGALWTAGVLLHVPAGVRLETPIRVVRYLTESGIAVFPRTLVIAEAGSHVAFVEEFVSPDFDRPTLSCGAVEVYAREGAQVMYVGMQRWGRGVRHLSTQRTIAERDASLDTLVVNLGGTVARVDMATQLQGAGARSDMLGLYFGREDQHFDHNTRQDHIAPHASSDLLYKGALYDRAHAVFRGIIKVHPQAQRTDAYQTNRNLLLSEEARADSLPNLEIEADDVRCSHGATVGQMDEEEIFYLMTRGLNRRTAESLVVFGFFGEVLDRLPLPGVVQELRDRIGRLIG